MTNPFQVRSQPASPPSKGRFNSRRLLHAQVFNGLAVLLSAIGFLLLVWAAWQMHWLPQPIQRWLSPPGPTQVFATDSAMSRAEARALYRQALADLQAGSYAEALSAFKQLEASYPGLQDMLWLHQAEAYAGQGNEWAVQKKLTTLIERYPESPLRTLARYRVGQSQFRGSDFAQARQTFRQVQQEAPQSDYAAGSLYYLGAIDARNPETLPQAIAALKSYLSQCANCTFSSQAAVLLEPLLPRPTATEHALLGLGQINDTTEPKQALAHLEQGPLNQTWFALGKVQIQQEQKAKGVQTLMDGLPYAPDMDTARAAVDLILAQTPSSQHTRQLQILHAKNLKTGGDYVLWKLAVRNPGQAQQYYKTILNQYPQGDYAPESAWNLLWPLLNKGRDSDYLAQAKAFMSRYPYANSAPKVLFWMGKRQERTSPKTAAQTYQQLLHQYPNDYYAFRAHGRLQAVAHGKTDPGWRTRAQRPDYPQQDYALDTLDILPAAETFAPGAAGQLKRNVAQELQAIGATEDVKLLVSQATGTLPPAVESWASLAAGDKPKGIRAIRDALSAQEKEHFFNTGTIQPAGTPDSLKLLYPVFFTEEIAPAAGMQKLDPFLVQALMREESYFNEFAVSTSNARGLMQLLPSTAREVAHWEKLAGFQTEDLFRPDVNIRLGSRYLGHLHELFQGNPMPSVGAYNGGPNAMKRWIQASPHFASDPDMFVERIPYEQSRDYIKKVFGSYWNYTRLYGHS